MFTGFLGATFYLVAEAQTHLSESPGPLSPVIRLPPHLAPGWCWATLVSSSSLSKVRSCTPQWAAYWMWETALQGLAKMIREGATPRANALLQLPLVWAKARVGAELLLLSFLTLWGQDLSLD